MEATNLHVFQFQLRLHSNYFSKQHWNTVLSLKCQINVTVYCKLQQVSSSHMEKLASLWHHSVYVGGGASDIQVYSELIISTVSNTRSRRFLNTSITNMLQNQWRPPEINVYCVYLDFCWGRTEESSTLPALFFFVFNLVTTKIKE